MTIDRSGLQVDVVEALLRINSTLRKISHQLTEIQQENHNQEQR